MSPSDFIKHLTIYKTPWEKHTEEDKKSYLPYIMNIWLSMNPDLIEIVNQVQSQQVPNRDHYNFFLKVLPKKSMFFRWIKPRKKEYGKDVVEKLASFYSVSSHEILECINILSEQQIKTILSNMGISEKEQLKLLKN